MVYLYAKTSGTGIVLLALMYIRVAASLANSERFVSSDLIAPSSRGERSTHSTPSWNEIRIVQLKLPHAGIWEVSQKQRCPPRRLLTKRQRAGALNSAYWKAVARSHLDGMPHSGTSNVWFREEVREVKLVLLTPGCLGRAERARQANPLRMLNF